MEDIFSSLEHVFPLGCLPWTAPTPTSFRPKFAAYLVLRFLIGVVLLPVLLFDSVVRQQMGSASKGLFCVYLLYYFTAWVLAITVSVPSAFSKADAIAACLLVLTGLMLAPILILTFFFNVNIRNSLLFTPRVVLRTFRGTLLVVGALIAEALNVSYAAILTQTLATDPFVPFGEASNEYNIPSSMITYISIETGSVLRIMLLLVAYLAVVGVCAVASFTRRGSPASVRVSVLSIVFAEVMHALVPIGIDSALRIIIGLNPALRWTFGYRHGLVMGNVFVRFSAVLLFCLFLPVYSVIRPLTAGDYNVQDGSIAVYHSFWLASSPNFPFLNSLGTMLRVLFLMVATTYGVVPHTSQMLLPTMGAISLVSAALTCISYWKTHSTILSLCRVSFSFVPLSSVIAVWAGNSLNDNTSRQVIWIGLIGSCLSLGVIYWGVAGSHEFVSVVPSMDNEEASTSAGVYEARSRISFNNRSSEEGASSTQLQSPRDSFSPLRKPMASAFASVPITTDYSCDTEGRASGHIASADDTICDVPITDNTEHPTEEFNLRVGEACNDATGASDASSISRSSGSAFRMAAAHEALLLQSVASAGNSRDQVSESEPNITLDSLQQDLRSDTIPLEAADLFLSPAAVACAVPQESPVQQSPAQESHPSAAVGACDTDDKHKAWGADVPMEGATEISNEVLNLLSVGRQALYDIYMLSITDNVDPLATAGVRRSVRQWLQSVTQDAATFAPVSQMCFYCESLLQHATDKVPLTEDLIQDVEEFLQSDLWHQLGLEDESDLVAVANEFNIPVEALEQALMNAHPSSSIVDIARVLAQSGQFYSEPSSESAVWNAATDCESQDQYKIGGYHRVLPNEVFNNRYRALAKLGWGQFSTVWLAWDGKDKKFVALKITKSDPQYRAASASEMIIFSDMNAKIRGTDEATMLGASEVVQMLDYFDHHGPHGNHLVLVFELCGSNLLELIKAYNFQGIDVHIVRVITRQILKGLVFLHNVLGVAHTDVKPENILQCRPDPTIVDIIHQQLENGIDLDDCTTPEPPRPPPGYTPNVSDSLKTWLAHTQSPIYDPQAGSLETWARELASYHRVKISDLGASRSLTEVLLPSIIQTREYRAPEVVLGFGGPYVGSAADIWSVACVVYEFVTGDYLFDPKREEGDTDLAHLRKYQELLGPIPRSMLSSPKATSASLYFHPNGKFKGGEIETHSLESLLAEHGVEPEEAQSLASFLRCILKINPRERATAAQLLTHPWLNVRPPVKRADEPVKVPSSVLAFAAQDDDDYPPPTYVN